MAEHAARAAIAAAGLEPGEIDLISYGTTTPDLVFPNAGVLLQARLGCRGAPAFAWKPPAAGSSMRWRWPISSCAPARRGARW